MKSKRMVWSLVLLSPYCLDAAAASSSAPNSVHWEVVQAGSKLTFTRPNHTLQASKLALEEAEHSVKFVTPLKKLDKDIYLQELKTKTQRTAYHISTVLDQTIAQPPYLPNKDEDVSAELRTQMCQDVATLFATGDAEQRENLGVNVSTLLAPFKKNNACTIVAGQHYNWTREAVATDGKRAIWRPELTEAPKENEPAVRNLTALQNDINSSVRSENYAENLKQAAVIMQLMQNSAQTIAQAGKTLPTQIAELTKQRDALFASLKLDPAQAYRIQAVVDYFKQGSTEEQIFNEAFGTALETMNNRPAVVRMLTEVERHVQDPNIGAWIANTYEPKEVKELRVAMAAYGNETNHDAKATLLDTCNALVSTIHADALKNLNTSVIQAKDCRDKKFRAETKPFEAQVGELRNVLRQLNELHTIQAVLNESAPVAASAASSSASA